MAQYKNKPLMIDAIQFTGNNQFDVLAFCRPNLSPDALNGAQVMKLPVIVSTESGEEKASSGDWIIKNAKGEFSLCKPDVFAASYDPA